MNQCDSDPFHSWLRTCVWCNDWPSTSYLLGACLVLKSSTCQTLQKTLWHSSRHRLSCLPVSVCLSRLFVTAGICILCVCDSINMTSLFIATFSIAKICKTNTAATNPNNPSPKIHPRRPTLPQRKCQLSVKRNTKLEMKGGEKGGQQHWHCDVQGALCWSARPKLKLRRYHLHTGFFNARHERSIEI